MKKPNKYGCIVSEDVCIEHDDMLVCDHGCELAKPHTCKDATSCSYCDKMCNINDLLDRKRKNKLERIAWVINTDNELCDECSRKMVK